MSIQNLDAFFAPQHVALVGASPKAGSVGLAFAQNLLSNQGKRRVSFVNPNHQQIEGVPCFPSLAALGQHGGQQGGQNSG